MRYVSTRGASPEQDFEQVLLTGLAPDGGLYVPKEIPKFSQQEIASFAGLSYQDLVMKVITPFVAGSIDTDELRRIVDASYAQFDHPSIAPLTMLGPNEWVLELYHGPTLAFKDFALQVLGRLLEYVLKKNKQRVVILGATSGDTGSAALEGCRHSEHVDIFILHPHKRVSDVQRKQMTTVLGDNVHNLAVKGNFDDCQEIVKAAFADQSFLPEGRQLVAVNSINWARIMVQIVYYFHAALSLGGPAREVSFSVPTGNFGDIYAGYLAKQMGLPIKQLIVATNSNDILHRFIANNEYHTGELLHTYSPSMDILVSSNFERYLFDLFGRDSEKLGAFMADLNGQAKHLSDAQWQQMKTCFDSCSVDDTKTCEVIAQVYKQSGLLLDPHTAIGVQAARQCNADSSVPMISLSTAHPAKFAEAISAAGIATPALPAHLSDLFEREEKYTVVENSQTAVQDFVSANTRR